jgi:hypothetical protein
MPPTEPRITINNLTMAYGTFVNEASPQQAAGYHKEGHCL